MAKGKKTHNATFQDNNFSKTFMLTVLFLFNIGVSKQLQWSQHIKHSKPKIKVFKYLPTFIKLLMMVQKNATSFFKNHNLHWKNKSYKTHTAKLSATKCPRITILTLMFPYHIHHFIGCLQQPYVTAKAQLRGASLFPIYFFARRP